MNNNMPLISAHGFILDLCAWLRDTISVSPEFSKTIAIEEIRHSLDSALSQITLHNCAHVRKAATEELNKRISMAISKIKDGSLESETISQLETLLPEKFSSYFSTEFPLPRNDSVYRHTA